MADKSHVPRMLPIKTILEDHGVETACLIRMLRRSLGAGETVPGDEGVSLPSPDESRLSRLMIDHEVVNLAFRKGGLEDFRADDARRSLQSSLRLRTSWNLVLFRETVSLSEHLRGRGVEVLFYKGLVLCDLLYGDLTTRPTRDVDILVRSVDFLRLRQELLRMGFTEDYHFPLRHSRYYMGVNREAAFSRMLPDGLALNVEVQWAPVLPVYSVPYDNAPFFRSASTAEWGDARIPVPSLEDQFLLLLAHHGVSELWHSLKHVADLAFFLRERGGELDWVRVCRRIGEWGMGRNAGVGFALCRDLLGSEIPSGLHVSGDAALLSRMRRRLLADGPPSRDQILPSNMLLQLRLTEGLTAKGRLLGGYLRKWVSPGLQDLERLRLPRLLFPLYYLLKPFRFLYLPRS
jgi:hypothetical protein